MNDLFNENCKHSLKFESSLEELVNIFCLISFFQRCNVHWSSSSLKFQKFIHLLFFSIERVYDISSKRFPTIKKASNTISAPIKKHSWKFSSFSLRYVFEELLYYFKKKVNIQRNSYQLLDFSPLKSFFRKTVNFYEKFMRIKFVEYKIFHALNHYQVSRTMHYTWDIRKQLRKFPSIHINSSKNVKRQRLSLGWMHTLRKLISSRALLTVLPCKFGVDLFTFTCYR